MAYIFFLALSTIKDITLNTGVIEFSLVGWALAQIIQNHEGIKTFAGVIIESKCFLAFGANPCILALLAILNLTANTSSVELCGAFGTNTSLVFKFEG